MTLNKLSTVYSCWPTSPPPKLCPLVTNRICYVRFEVMLMLLKIISEVQVIC